MKRLVRHYTTRKSLKDSLGKSDFSNLFSLSEKLIKKPATSSLDSIKIVKETKDNIDSKGLKQIRKPETLSFDSKLVVKEALKDRIDRSGINQFRKSETSSFKQSKSTKFDMKTERVSKELKVPEIVPEGPTVIEIPEEDEVITEKRYSKKGQDRDKLKRLREQAKKEKKVAAGTKSSKPKVRNIYLQEGVTVANLSSLLEVPLKKVIRKMVEAGFEEYSPDYVLNSEIASMIVLEFNMNPIVTQEDSVDLEPRPEPADWSFYPHRPPVITIMGHVDHGKTTLLDSLRKTSVAAGEAGGITQHIGAFSVELPSGKQITFLDTPGHAAFSQMRQRGAKCTDIVVLVVAADDGVMPQTIEAIQHAQEANVPIIVAINKCDKPNVDPTKVLNDLMRHNIMVEDLGGEIPAVKISGKTGLGLEELEETILTIAEVVDYRGDSTGLVEGVIIESKMSKELGNVATILVKRGTLTPGSIIVAGNTWCKVRRMISDNGSIITTAGPSYPVEVLGWKELPEAGDLVLQAESESLAKRVAKNRTRKSELFQSIKDIDALNEKRVQKPEEESESKSKIKEYRVVLKADVNGSLEAIENVLNALPTHEVAMKIVSSGVGAIAESDVEFAFAANADIYAFNVPVGSKHILAAKQAKLNITSHSVIYTLIDRVKEGMSELLAPEIIHNIVGEAVVLQLFPITIKKKSEIIAGCRIQSGQVFRNHLVRVIRNGEMVHEGKIKNFKHHKKDIMEAAKGLECGINIEGFDDIQVGDVIQSIDVITKKRTIQ